MMKELKKYMLFLLVLMAMACKKSKTDFEYDNRQVRDPRKNSSIRIVSLNGYNQTQVNGDTLTNYVVRGFHDPLEGRFPGTLYFPENGRLGTTWYLPQGFLDNGTAKVLVETALYQQAKRTLILDIKEELQPFDYYLLPTEKYEQVTGQPDYVKVPRSVASPANPSSFKIRILNLSAKVRATEDMENLLGSMSLTWADGTSVNMKTNNIAPGQYSEYVEVPYTTAQFKVLTGNGIQVPGVGPEELDPATSTWRSGASTNLTYGVLKTYAPGGIYTIVVTPREFNIPLKNGNPGEQIKAYQNAYRTINDIAEPLNLTYGRVQAVNAIPGTSGLKVLVNGKTLGTALNYTAHTDYENLIVGSYDITAVDAAGTVLASTKLKLDPNTNFTLWVHPDANGKATVSAVANDLSGSLVVDAGDDASNSRYQQEYPFSVRFLNLCPDVPYLTMTTNNGQAFSSLYGFNTAAVNNLRPGIFPTEFPYIRPYQEAKPYQFIPFRSSPSVLPGTWASDIPILTGQDLIARPELYVRGPLPNHEPGFYTIALVGSTKPSSPTAEKAKMIIVKHSK